ncbi:MAG: choice-of-anchor tandem repeat GloVer-containing protein [Bryobacteraceae bacterium]|jgi:uncharacterized repeat protein (TIGR03803 family)
MKSKSLPVTNNLTLALACVLGLAATLIPGAQAQTFSVFHSFTGTGDGANPLSGLVTDGTGNLYGTGSYGGGSSNGVVFKLTAAGVVTVLHNFNGGSDGANPEGVLILDKAGNLYGTTTAGGASGAGTVFKVTGAGQESVLYSFSGAADGAIPEAGLARDPAGNLYGTTTGGGASGNGTVFKLSPPKQKGAAWTEQVLYSFGTGSDGAIPVGGVTFDSAGNLYGTTSAGGPSGYGTVFQLTRSGSGWTENILHDFGNGDDGSVPYAGLISDKAGNFYGAATQGGTAEGGTIFELTPGSSGWTFTVLYSIPGWGISGAFRDLIMDPSGNLYGTTHCDGTYSAGTVYKLTPAASGYWTYTSLYVFTGGTDGLYSYSNLVFEHGSVYGTTNAGGADGLGVVFQIAP